MRCEKCGKERDVYELYSGEFVCVKCKKPITIKEFEITTENSEKFTLSEILFHEALQTLSRVDNSHQNAKLAHEKITKAVELCKQAALGGNPNALLRLAYYYETNHANVDNITAFKVACNYYERIWRNEFRGKTVSKSVYLRKIAARRHLDLLQNPPDQLRNGQNRSFDYDEKAGQMFSLGLLDEIPARRETSVPESDDSARITSLLNMSLHDGRTPLFGLMYVNGETFSDWANSRYRLGKKETSAIEYFTNRSELRLYLIHQNEMPCRITDKEFLQNNTIEPDDDYYLCFASSRNRRLVGYKKYLESEGMLPLAQLQRKASQTKNDYIFYPDDVLAFCNHWWESIPHATKDLVAHVLASVNKG